MAWYYQYTWGFEQMVRKNLFCALLGGSTEEMHYDIIELVIYKTIEKNEPKMKFLC